MVGVDAARGMVREAAGTAPSGFSVRFVEARVENLPFLSGWFDAVTSTVSFHHWRDQRAGLAEIGRVLAPGAVLALADISPSGAMLVLRPLLRRHGRFPPSAGLDSMLQAAGFASVRRVRVPGMGGAMLVVMARKDPARVRARAPARGRAGSPSGRKALPILGGRDRSG